MPIDQTPLTDALQTLKDQMSLAATRGTTDEDERRHEKIRQFGKQIINLAGDFVDRGDGRGGLSSLDLIKALAGVTGCCIKVCAPDLETRTFHALEAGVMILEVALGAG